MKIKSAITLMIVFVLGLCLAGTISAQTKSYGDIDVIMYSTNWCPHCKTAKEYLGSLGVSLVVYDVDADKEKKAEMLKKSGGSNGVPLIDVEGIIIRGDNQIAIKKAVEEKRNPE